MKTTTLKPDKFLRPTHRKQEISSEILHDFKQKLCIFLANIHEPSREGKQETDLRDFLNDALYKGKFYINKKETIDWAIHNGMDAKSKVAVLIEVKKTAEKTDMFTEGKPNVKALHELVLYYLRERIDNNNHEIKYLIATNCHEWYFFNELWFNENIFTTKLKKTYKDWKLSGHGTDDFYKLHAKSYLETLEKNLEFCKVDIRDYTKANDKKLSELYKILSPEHLLKQEIANDANKLNKPFYNELLYLIGIEERKDDKSNKKIIERLLPAHRKEGSLLENTIEQLDTKNALAKVPNLESYGDTEEEQKYSVALELNITWLNRLLFLKLLEGQLIKYHNGDRKYRFLTSDRINDFDELGELFFGVLAKRPTERKPSVQQKFGDIPYLNSSLFEETILENSVLSVEILKDRLVLPLFGNTVLKDTNGKVQKGEVKTLKYLLDFLDSYDFGSKDEKEVAAAKNTEAVNHDRTINAAVLGLIFEKLNGYKDGSFFTPSFITMYMCRETLRRAVVQKFNEAQSLNCQDFAELKDHLDDDYKKPEKRKSYNDLLNSIRICDPAVGSGHFLVSALNEMIAIKAELKILQHPNGTRLKGYEISIENDELIVWEEDTQKDFQYKIGQAGKPFQELQIIQETLFHEKRTIIENCLFGVDINPKSVSICQLRLWIELLKNAFYTPESNYLYLETLPNIDINIKTGNSLVSKYSLTEDLSEVFKKQKFSLKAYQSSVYEYKEARSKSAKADLQKFINEIKEQFKQSLLNNDPKKKKIKDLKEEYRAYDNVLELFGSRLSAPEKEKKKIELRKKIETLESEVVDIIDSKIYRNSFEWRFEFPEVLNENGDFIGFDVVVGNPPYFSLSKIKEFETVFKGYETYSKSADIYCLFYEKSLQIIREKGLAVFITSNSWMKTQYGEPLRKFFVEQTNPLVLINIEDAQVFEEATVESNILLFQKSSWEQNLAALIFDKSFHENVTIEEYLKGNKLLLSELDVNGWNISNPEEVVLKSKIEHESKLLKDWNICINRGVLTGFNEAFIISEETKDILIAEDSNNIEIIKPMLRGRDIAKYSIDYSSKWLIFTRKGIDIDKYPSTKKHLNQYYEQLKPRNNNELTGRKAGSYKWFEIQDNVAYFKDFEKEKIIWGEISDKAKFSFDDLGYYAEATLFVMTGEHLKYILPILNSKLSEWYFAQISTTTGMGTNRWKKYKIERLPIKPISETNQAPFIEKVNQILALKKADSKADTSELEAQIDRMVYDLYELTEEEILIVEGK